MNRVEATGAELMRQAQMTAEVYLIDAITSIDKKLGVGYAAAHPELIGAFINASAIDFGASVIARALEAIADREGS